MAITFTFDSPVGLLAIKAEKGCLTGIELFPSKKNIPVKSSSHTPLAKKVKQQLHQYFLNSHSLFKLMYQLEGTTFQKKVWKIMLTIPEGQVMTYGEIAKKLNSSARAVGNACRANPLPIIVPCHRVVSQTGLGGFAGKTSGKRLEVKRWLLSHEGALVKGL